MRIAAVIFWHYFHLHHQNRSSKPRCILHNDTEIQGGTQWRLGWRPIPIYRGSILWEDKKRQFLVTLFRRDGHERFEGTARRIPIRCTAATNRKQQQYLQAEFLQNIRERNQRRWIRCIAAALPPSTLRIGSQQGCIRHLPTLPTRDQTGMYAESCNQLCELSNVCDENAIARFPANWCTGGKWEEEKPNAIAPSENAPITCLNLMIKVEGAAERGPGAEVVADCTYSVFQNMHNSSDLCGLAML